MPVWKAFFLALWLGTLLACGGSGGGAGGGAGAADPSPTSPASGLSFTVDSQLISATGYVNSPTPSAELTVTVIGTPPSGTQLYLFCQTSTTGISNVSLASASGNTAVLRIDFIAPALLSPGTYTDSLALTVATDAAGKYPITGSPMAIRVSYMVSFFPAPVITSLSPASAAAGDLGFTLTINGTLFNQTSQVQWNGSSRQTTFISGTQLIIAVSAADIASLGGASVTVSNVASGGWVSAPASFSIGPAALSLRAVAPAAATAGGPGFTLTAYGSQFSAASTILWNGSPRATTCVSSNQLTAQIPAGDIGKGGTAMVTVLNPAGQGGLSNACQVTINSGDAVTIQIDPGHSGSVVFPSMTLPSARLWQVQFQGTPSYALIAQGKVYVTVTGPENSVLVALDQATGATVWGPVALPAKGDATYDNGQVFVLSCKDFGNPATALAFDAGTGALRWSTRMPGTYGVVTPPAAANGFLYAINFDGTLAAFNESDGTLAWTGRGGAYGSPAITPGAVYVGNAQALTALDPATGAILWSDPLGGSGTDGATPVVANGLVYARTGGSGANASSGQVLLAATGAKVGTFSSDNPPAITATTSYFVQGGILRAIQAGTGTVLWSFNGDGHAMTSPLVVNDVVFVASEAGRIYGVDASTGATVWLQGLLGYTQWANQGNSTIPHTGLAVGNGLLVIPATSSGMVEAYRLAPMR